MRLIARWDVSRRKASILALLSSGIEFSHLDTRLAAKHAAQSLSNLRQALRAPKFLNQRGEVNRLSAATLFAIGNESPVGPAQECKWDILEIYWDDVSCYRSLA